ncbi:uncharacterized protein BX664DRAFT_327562 [Halteromyces radiatus]|uniref:uncharacterized protein n=1 Tax=Halteromyces radiatus TaxID=101107 RepID=UPI00221E9566|nr:uncharacterized protein BX664DRAFT_327562 [Halteromyces radiatus]KAI8092548.1 hypothetical protein BX664DRAFT_327562 [Halteromyces radiatus]
MLHYANYDYPYYVTYNPPAQYLQQQSPLVYSRGYSQPQTYDLPLDSGQHHIQPPRVNYRQSYHQYHSQPHHHFSHSHQDLRMFQDYHQQPRNRQRRSSTGSNWPSTYSSSSLNNPEFHYENNDNNNNNDDDGESLNSMEILAMENAKKNERPAPVSPDPSFDADNLSIPISALPEENKLKSKKKKCPYHDNKKNEPSSSSTVPSSTSPTMPSPETSSNVSVSTVVSASDQEEIKEPTKKPRWKFTKLFRRSSTGSSTSKVSSNFLFTPSPSNSQESSNTSDSLRKQQPSIVTYRSALKTAVAEEEAKLQQQQHQESRLKDLEKTSKLDFIWVFKAPPAASQLLSYEKKANVWTGFDYKNQELITNYAVAMMNDQVAKDPGLELVDSHIRKGSLPFLLVLHQQLVYYPTSNNKIDKIEINCLPNNKETILLRKKN